MAMSSKKLWLSAFSYRDFRLLWTGEFISAVGTDMQFVALSWQLYLLTHSALALGLVGAVRFVPILLFSLIGGTFADAHNRKKILYITQAIIALSSLFLAVVSYTNHASSFLLYITTALVAGAVSFDLPARQALIPSLVARKDLQNALSIYSIIWEFSRIVGPVMAGFLIAVASVSIVYTIDFLSTLAVIIALVLMKTSGEPLGEKITISLQSVKDGLTFVKSKTIIWSTMLLDFFSTFFASATALLPIYAQDILHVGPQGLGFLVAAPSVGALVAAIFMARFSHNIQKQGTILLLAVAMYATATVFFGLSSVFILSLFALSLVGAGDTISMVIRQTVRQFATPDNMRGRMMSISQIFFFGGPHLGEFEAGLLAALVGAPLSVALGGIATLGVVGIMAMTIPKLRNYTHSFKE